MISHSSGFDAGLQAELQALAPGFVDPVHESQAVFRNLLEALARPGRIYHIEAAPSAGDAIGTVPLAAFAALLALCDHTTPVWLQRPDAALARAVQFHTGAPIVDDAAGAAFAYMADPAAPVSLEAFPLGQPETPERSATLLLRVDALEGGRPLTLTGPGIETQARIAPAGISDAFWAARAALAPSFPCGVDCYLLHAATVLGIPRTTHVEFN